MPIRYGNLLLLSLLLLVSSCGNFEKVRKSSDVNYKLSKANEYYTKGEYQRANELYESLIPVMKNTRNYEPLYYRYCFTFYYMKDYLQAAFNFKNFGDFFPSSKDADECEYNTIKAYESLGSFVNAHPKSKFLTEANGYLEQCKEKMEAKEADAAKLYYNISQFKAASVSFKTVMTDYPESGRSDYYQFMIMKSFYYYAVASIAEKQVERFNKVISAYSDLKENYPHSTHLHDAEKIYTLANNYLNKLQNEHK